MKKAAWLKYVGACLLGATSLAVAKEPRPIVASMAWHISVDAQGRIISLSTQGTKLAGLRDRIEKEIRSWQFNPGKVDGIPAPSESTLVVTLTATPTDREHYAVRVTKVATGGGYSAIAAPQYPHAALVSHRQGFVVLKVDYDVDGKVLDAALADGAPKVDPPFVKVSIAAVRQWVFIPEVVGGHPRAGTAFVPVCFTLGMHARPPTCEWERPGDNLKVSGNDMVALDAEVTLKSDVAGRAL